MECGAGFALRGAGCATELPGGAKFCLECGTATGAPNPVAPERNPRDYMPKHLADKILQSKSALEGERKQVTVLFADVKGSMDLQEQAELEAWHRASERFSRLLAEGVHRYEGTVNQYTGDGIMAIFGAPMAHEDHAQRACYAALHLVGELRRFGDELRMEQGLSFAMRIGLNSGEVKGSAADGPRRVPGGNHPGGVRCRAGIEGGLRLISPRDGPRPRLLQAGY